jgi:alkylation response protein AidB-like acyl-CoA dehydrogenase
MSEYHAPVKEMLFVLRELVGLDAVARLPGLQDATPDVVEAVLGEAAALANKVIGPTNRLGDEVGTRVENGQVIVPPQFAEAYRQFVAGGWPGVAQDVEIGGQGLPYAVGIAVEEMWQSANLAWSLGPLLTQGAARAVQVHGSPALQAQYLEPLATGRWSGTMVLTEPQAGSDLGAIRTQAVPEGDHYRLTGQKIFITWGDHDMTENVVHLVLARLPDAPPGTKGISMFLVPKYLPDADGRPGKRNGVTAVSVEHKLGIHGSPTCVLAFDNAFAHLIGEKHNGLVYMFTMMNHARLNVGLEGVSIAERAYQQARAYARERVQGNAPGAKGRSAIIQHPDVRRMLLTMKAQIEAMRSVAYVTAAEFDFAHRLADAAGRARHQARLELLTPVVKGWCTETGQYLTSVALQVHGGMGYIEETGAAQHYRDSRITTIYEGTTGIQAGDLVGRKILRDNGAALQALIADMAATAADLARDGERLAAVCGALKEGVESVAAAGKWLAANVTRHPGVPGAVSYNLLMLIGTVAGGWQMARAAAAAVRQLATKPADAAFYEAKLLTARHYAAQVMPFALGYRKAIVEGSEALLAMPEEQF